MCAPVVRADSVTQADSTRRPDSHAAEPNSWSNVSTVGHEAAYMLHQRLRPTDAALISAG